MFGCDNVDQGMVIALTCMSEGITPLDFQRRYHIIQKRPSMRSDAMLAEFRNHGGTHKVIERTTDAAEVELIHAPTKTSGKFRLTWEDAQNEDFTKGKDGEIKDNYAYPRKRMQMLWARVISDGVRTLMPEIVAGIYTPEEVQDIVDVEFTTASNGAPKKTAAEALAENAKRAAVEVEQPTAAEAATVNDAIDAEFDVIGAEDIADQPATDEAPWGDMASNAQIELIREMYTKCGITHEQQEKALKKRGINSLKLLAKEDAAEIISKLQAVAAKN